MCLPTAIFKNTVSNRLPDIGRSWRNGLSRGLVFHPDRKRIQTWSRIFTWQGRDTGGLLPVEDDNAATRKSSPSTNSLSAWMEHWQSLSSLGDRQMMLDFGLSSEFGDELRRSHIYKIGGMTVQGEALPRLMENGRYRGGRMTLNPGFIMFLTSAKSFLTGWLPFVYKLFISIH